VAGVTLTRVVKSFGTHPVIRSVDLEIREGEFAVFVGPSGCGKSTLLRMIAGLESTSGGEIRIGQRVVNDLPPRDRDIAMVFQDYALYPHKSVYENMAFGLRMRKRAEDEVDKRVREAAQVLQIGHLLERRPRDLSGGQRQRVAMGRAIVRDPQVFLFDEPLSNLDAQLRAEMRVEIKRLHQRLGATTIYVTHDQVEAMTLADRIVVLRAGEIVQVGSPDDIYNRPAARFVAGFTGSPPMNFTPARLEGGGSRVRLAGVADLALPVGRQGGQDDREVLFGIRPEDIALPGAAGGERAPIEVTVQLVEPLGSDLLAILAIGDAEVTGRFPPDCGLKVGERRTVTLDMAKFHLFDPASGNALGGRA
jgi:multiple sugar transport system ATP-binding protein